MNIDLPPKPADRLHRVDWIELRGMIRDIVREEVRRALAESDSVGEPAAEYGNCIGGCINGWKPCVLCIAGALPTYDGISRSWIECHRCAGSGSPGFLRCPVCRL